MISFSFEVLDDPPNTSSTISSTLQTSSSIGTASGTASSSSSSSSSGTQGHSLTVEHDLAISMGVVGTLLAVLLIFLLWWFCIRRKGGNGGNMNQITPQYHPVPTTPGNGTFPLIDNSISMTSDGSNNSRYEPSLQKYGSIIILLPPCSNFFISNNLYGPPITLSYDHGSTSYSGLPFPLYTNQSGSSLPRTPQVHHGPQRRISTLSMMSDRPPMYYRDPVLDESAPISSSSSSGNTNEKSGRSRIPANTVFTTAAEPEVELMSTAIPGRHEKNVSVWDSGYPQPLKFVPIA